MWTRFISLFSTKNTDSNVESKERKSLAYRKLHRFDYAESAQAPTSYQPSIDKV